MGERLRRVVTGPRKGGRPPTDAEREAAGYRRLRVWLPPDAAADLDALTAGQPRARTGVIVRLLREAAGRAS